jgi:hypothetical protein
MVRRSWARAAAHPKARAAAASSSRSWPCRASARGSRPHRNRGLRPREISCPAHLPERPRPHPRNSPGGASLRGRHARRLQERRTDVYPQSPTHRPRALSCLSADHGSCCVDRLSRDDGPEDFHGNDAFLHSVGHTRTGTSRPSFMSTAIRAGKTISVRSRSRPSQMNRAV